jgi:hypothetical protein
MGNSTTLNNLADKRSVIVAIRPEEEEYYRTRDYNVMVLPPDCIGLGAAQHYIFNNAEADLVWLADDDLKNTNLDKDIEYISYYAGQEQAGIFGLGRHFMKHIRIEKDGIWTRTGSTGGCWGVNKKMYQASGLDSSPWTVVCDLYLWIGMQAAGYGALISNLCIMKGGEGKTGGCVDYRTNEMVVDAVYKLQEAFPRYFHIFPSDTATIQRHKVGLGFRVEWKRIHEDNFKSLI